MPDLDEALQEIGRFSSSPPEGEPNLARVEALASERRRVRQYTATTTFVAVLALLFVTAITSRESRDGPVVAASSTSTDPGRPDHLTVVPADGLESNDFVGVTLPVAPSGDLIVAQCASEAAAGSPERWCEVAVTSDAMSSEDFRMPVNRVISTSNGLVDCAERRGRCVIGVRSGGRDFTAPISFRSDLPAVKAPTLAVETSGPGAVVVTGAGFEPGAEVFLRQCRPSTEQSETDSMYDQCDFARPNRPTADSSGRFRLEIVLFREIFDPYSGWTTCDPCQLRAGAFRTQSVVVAVDASAGRSDRPQVEIIPSGPFRPGQIVELRGTGFRPNMPAGEIVIAWCRFATQQPTGEVRGVGAEYASCANPTIGHEVVTDDEGNLLIPEFPMPEGPFGPAGESCDSPGARCGLAWHPSEGSAPVFVTEFDIVS